MLVKCIAWLLQMLTSLVCPDNIYVAVCERQVVPGPAQDPRTGAELLSDAWERRLNLQNR